MYPGGAKHEEGDTLVDVLHEESVCDESRICVFRFAREVAFVQMLRLRRQEDSVKSDDITNTLVFKAKR